MRAFFMAWRMVVGGANLMYVKVTLNSVKTRGKCDSWLATRQARHYNVARRAVGRAGQ